MMTGQYAHTHGKMAHMKMKLEPKPAVIPEILSTNGYRTALVGKTHWWPSNDDLGCDQAYMTIDNALTPELGRNDAYIRFLEKKGLFLYNEDTWATDNHRLAPDNLPFDCLKVNWTGNKACELLEALATQQANDGQPFFLFCSFVEPHGPGSVQSELLDRFEDISLPPAVWHQGEHDGKPETQRRAVQNWSEGLTQNDKDRKRRGVYASLSQVDANIGRILDKVTKLSLEDSTIIIFLTDHGDLMYDHGCIEKTFLYGGAARIPLILAGPGIPNGQTRQHLVSQIDLLPTILELCGLQANSELNIDGHSIMPIVYSPQNRGRRVLFCEVDQTVHLNPQHDGCRRKLVSSSQAKMLRTGVWKYIYTLIDGHKVEQELYDLESAPDEMHNLAAEVHVQGRIEEFRAELLRWLMATEVNRLHPEPISHYAEPRIDGKYF